LSRSGMTRLIDRLQAAGLLAREPAAEDRRGAYAVLLPAGDRAMARTWPVYESLVLEHFGAQFSDEEAKLFCEILGRLARVPHEAKPVPLTVRRQRRP
ncbi:MAG: MarR family winged helix-turn-helix transcriptional regulator, partial [Phycisphaerae bacterium]|nr:MarR family winged helix-turn-helix transcriptional regulator [Phycisphaerae bacterium]